MSKRKKAFPPCHVTSGYTRTTDGHDGRPQFRCDYCGGTWTSGKSGGKYLADARKPR